MIAHAAEQDRSDILKRRRAWFDGQIDLDPNRLVFIDETWTSTNMAHKLGRAPKGEGLRDGIPHGHWKTTTFVAGLRVTGMVAPMVIDRPINRISLKANIDQVLVPELRPGDVVVMDNLGSDKGPAVAAAIEAVGASLLFLHRTAPTSTRSRMPSPSSKPCCARSRDAPSKACGRPSAISSTPSRPRNAPTFFANAGYEAT